MDRIQTLPDIQLIAPSAWQALADSDNPFVSHAFLAGLERCGSIQPQWGWSPAHLVLHADGKPIGAVPAYRKTNSHGEFVFDHAWADAYDRYGLEYFPKLLGASPYSPVTGPRLLAGGDPAIRSKLAQALVEHARRQGWSSAHVNFAAAEDGEALAAAGFLRRQDIQFHWHNDSYRDFDDFLSRLTAKRRKETRRERERVARDGWRLQWLDGTTITDDQLDLTFDLYSRTFVDKGNHPALTRAFFAHLAQHLGDRFLVALARADDDGAYACAIFLRSNDALYGRYWGCERQSPGLHFEVCYYQGMDFCIAHGLRRFEPGAQGEHKLARGFLPSRTDSWHWIAHDGMRDAIAHSLRGERSWLDRYEESLLQHSPFAERAP
jgi:uncharacterized protein